MRVVTAGIGLRAGHMLSLLKKVMPETEIVGYYDPSSSHLEMIGSDVPSFPDVKSLLSDTTPDLFFVGSPNKFHLEHIKAGLEAGVRILTEKPVVTTIEDTMELAALLQKHGTDRVMVGLVLRYSQHMIDLRAALDQGALGQIMSLEANEMIPPYHGSFFMRDWRRSTELSGGFMLEKCCHDLDLYNMVTKSRPKRVASFGARRAFVPKFRPTEDENTSFVLQKSTAWNGIDDPYANEGDIIDCQTALMEFESGAHMTFHTNLNTPDEQRRFCVVGALGMAEGDFVRGYLNVTKRDGTLVARHDYNAGENAKIGAHYGADEMMCEEIARFLRSEIDTLPVGIVDALEAGIAALALDQARTTGAMVDLTSVWEKFDQFNLKSQGS